MTDREPELPCPECGHSVAAHERHDMLPHVCHACYAESDKGDGYGKRWCWMGEQELPSDEEHSERAFWRQEALRLEAMLEQRTDEAGATAYAMERVILRAEAAEAKIAQVEAERDEAQADAKRAAQWAASEEDRAEAAEKRLAEAEEELSLLRMSANARLTRAESAEWELAQAEKRLEAVRALHHKKLDDFSAENYLAGTYYCEGCGSTWPCPTIRAMEESK